MTTRSPNIIGVLLLLYSRSPTRSPITTQSPTRSPITTRSPARSPITTWSPSEVLVLSIWSPTLKLALSQQHYDISHNY